MRQTRALWLKIVQSTYPNVLKPIARQVQIEKVVARKRGKDAAPAYQTWKVGEGAYGVPPAAPRP